MCWVGETRLGIGRHEQDVRVDNLLVITHWQFYYSIIVTVGISLVKISLGFLLLRLVQKRLYRNCLIGMIGPSPSSLRTPNSLFSPFLPLLP